ncbi:MAG: hypothetical protein ACLPYZ_14410 [Limisphaerales bacterium]
MTLSGAYFQNQVEAAERREIVAHGGSRGLCRSQLSAPGGAKDSMSGRNFLPPHPGRDYFCPIIPRLPPWAAFLRASGAEEGHLMLLNKMIARANDFYRKSES